MKLSGRVRTVLYGTFCAIPTVVLFVNKEGKHFSSLDDLAFLCHNFDLVQVTPPSTKILPVVG